MKNINRFIIVAAVSAIPFHAMASAIEDSVTTDFTFHKQACTNSELSLLAGLTLQYRNAGENELRAIRAETINERPELKEQILSGVIHIPRSVLIRDALESDKLQYAVTCKSPMLIKSLKVMEESGRAERLRIEEILRKADDNE
jgi:hypothetical protein